MCSTISWDERTSKLRAASSGRGAQPATGLMTGSPRLSDVSTERWVLIAAVLGSGIVFLDSTVVNLALPRIGRDLPRSFLGVLEGQSYVYNAYLLTLSSLLIVARALSDFYGRRRMFVISLVGIGATSVVCCLARQAPTRAQSSASA